MQSAKICVNLRQLGTVQQVVTVTVSSELNVLVVGVLLVVFVVAAPQGIVGLFVKLKDKVKGF